VSSGSFDPVCEVVLTATNPNSQTTASTSDELCRHERTDGPLGSFAESFYQNIGTPGNQYVETLGPSPNGSGVSWTRTYLDGLGRSYKRESRGPTMGHEILSGEATFNQRGGVLASTATRYVGETAQMTSYDYDALDRLTKTTLPDSNTILRSYGLRETYVTYPEGDITGEARNETGLVRYVNRGFQTTMTDTAHRRRSTTSGTPGLRKNQRDTRQRPAQLSFMRACTRPVGKLFWKWSQQERILRGPALTSRGSLANYRRHRPKSFFAVSDIRACSFSTTRPSCRMVIFST